MRSWDFSPARQFTPWNLTVSLDKPHSLSFSSGCIPTADEGGVTSMSGGVPWLTLPAGYLGSSFIGATLITCGFDTDASKVASLVLAVFFLITLWWARKNLL